MQLACYPGTGERYLRHRDAFADGAAARRVTAIVYLNPAWRPAHGGCLRLHGPLGEAPTDVAPLLGRLLLLLADEVEHVYRKSDAVARVDVPDAAALAPAVADLREALESGGRAATQSAGAELVAGLLSQLAVPPVSVRVLAHRPEISGGELHGLYEAEEGEQPVISVWMRTAAQGRIVAFKTFLRTLLHEVVHHLDYDLLGLDDSFHTQGFLRRESSLVRQLLAAEPEPRRARRPAAPAPAPAPKRAAARRRAASSPTEAQLELPW